jgi:hypothetical protein
MGLENHESGSIAGQPSPGFHPLGALKPAGSGGWLDGKFLRGALRSVRVSSIRLERLCAHRSLGLRNGLSEAVLIEASSFLFPRAELRTVVSAGAPFIGRIFC